jgi:hypothetical protein
MLAIVAVATMTLERRGWAIFRRRRGSATRRRVVRPPRAPRPTDDPAEAPE